MYGIRQMCVFICISVAVDGIFVTGNTTKYRNVSISKVQNPAEWTEQGMWSPLLEGWALRSPDARKSRDFKPIPLGNYYITERKDYYITDRSDEPEEQPMKPVNSQRPPGKVVANKPQTGWSNNREVSETDLYLLGAIEKLVYRVDFMEKRLRKTEELLYYVMAGNGKKQEPCPGNFSRAGENCYHFGTARQLNWKSANAMCRSLGATLAEMENIVENQDVVTHIQTNSDLKGKDYWTGGLNPGLLWIWSNSARPVSGNNTTMAANNTDIKGKGRCLTLAHNPALRSYAYLGQDCATRHHYICEIHDKSLSNDISRMSKKLMSEDSSDFV